MLTKTEGIVFRKLPYSETSIICDIFTREHGLMSYIIGGVRKPRARTSASLLEVMSIVELLAYHSDKNKLHRIKELKPAYIYRSIPLDIPKNALILFLAELCSKTIREPEPNPELFDMIAKQLMRLDQLANGYGEIHLEFMIRLADILGFGPASNYDSDRRGFDLVGGEFCSDPPSTHMQFIADAGDLAGIIRQARTGEKASPLGRQRRNALVDWLILYFRIHVESLREMRSHQVLREVL